MLQQLSRISWASRQVRLTLIPLLALVLTHFVFYKKLPFEQGYEFPLQTFVSIVLWGICICEANALVYRYLNQISPLKAAPLRRLLLQMTHGLLATTIIYSILTLIFNWLEGAPFEWFAFLSYLLLLLGISGMENAIFLLKDFYDLYQNREIETSTIAPSERLEKPLLIKSGQRSLILNLDEIGLIYSSNGLVMLTTAEGQKHITQFTSLNEVEKELPQDTFFRINRQYLVHARTVRSVKEDINRKLQVNLNPEIANGHAGPHTVSRYRSSAFKNWLQVFSI